MDGVAVWRRWLGVVVITLWPEFLAATALQHSGGRFELAERQGDTCKMYPFATSPTTAARLAEIAAAMWQLADSASDSYLRGLRRHEGGNGFRNRFYRSAVAVQEAAVSLNQKDPALRVDLGILRYMDAWLSEDEVETLGMLAAIDTMRLLAARRDLLCGRLLARELGSVSVAERADSALRIVENVLAEKRGARQR